jgi:exonuclease III
MEMRFGTWNVKSMYRSGSLRAVAEKISKYKLDLVGVQEVRWGGGGTESADECTFFYGTGKNHEFGTVFFSYIRESYHQLRG